jgi:hypothetical protein
LKMDKIYIYIEMGLGVIFYYLIVSSWSRWFWGWTCTSFYIPFN